MLSYVKKACRDKTKTISLQAIALLFDLLESFSLTRNEYAPTIYKTLTYILIESYS